MKKLPLELPGACLSGKLTAFETASTVKAILAGQIKVLFVSPERLCAPSFRHLIRTLRQQQQQQQPEGQHCSESVVGLLCVDEAHCLSQWSYNFRPSFLRIRREIMFIRPRAVLALTATANSSIQKDIMQHLEIAHADEGVLFLPNRRSNLKLLARIFENNDDRFETVLKLIKKAANDSNDDNIAEIVEENKLKKRKRMSICPSGTRNVVPLSIVYVWRRDQVDSMCEYLKGRGVAAVAYHAGMDADQRERSQRLFDSGTARCVVATVAFGMGVDKADVRQVIHCYMVSYDLQPE